MPWGSYRDLAASPGTAASRTVAIFDATQKRPKQTNNGTTKQQIRSRTTRSTNSDGLDERHFRERRFNAVTANTTKVPKTFEKTYRVRVFARQIHSTRTMDMQTVEMSSNNNR